VNGGVPRINPFGDWRCDLAVWRLAFGFGDWRLAMAIGRLAFGVWVGVWRFGLVYRFSNSQQPTANSQTSQQPTANSQQQQPNSQQPNKPFYGTIGVGTLLWPPHDLAMIFPENAPSDSVAASEAIRIIDRPSRRRVVGRAQLRVACVTPLLGRMPKDLTWPPTASRIRLQAGFPVGGTTVAFGGLPSGSSGVPAPARSRVG